METELSDPELHSLINHVFLPARLPGTEDTISDRAILKAFAATGFLEKLSRHLLATCPATIKNITALLQNLSAVHRENGEVDECGVRIALTTLGHGETIPIKVSAQNAAILITREDDSLVFEGFELSPSNEAVYSTAGRLIRSFPGHAVKVPASLLHTADFTATLTHTITTLATQAVAEAQPQVFKGGVWHDEDRDTVSPVAVSTLLFGVLRGLSHKSHESSTIAKKTREEVVRTKGRPWRRSAMWMFIRVALQLTIVRSADGSHALYKILMALFTSELLDLCVPRDLPAEVLYLMGAKLDRKRSKLMSARCLSGWLDSIIEAIHKRSTEMIDSCWTDIQSKDARELDLASLAVLDFDADTRFNLPELDAHIESLLSHEEDDDVDGFGPATTFVPSDDNEAGPLPTRKNSTHTVADLYGFELWVAKDLDDWASAIPDKDNVCEELYKLIVKYRADASGPYANNPEGQSTMLLTLLELWRACDEAAIEACPFLKEYSLEFPVHLLQSLLLTTMDQLERLSKLETYFALRDQGPLRMSQLFAIQSSKSFAARFYDSSPRHQELHGEIASLVHEKREEKRREFEGLQAEAKELIELHNTSSCVWYDVVTKKEVVSPLTGERSTLETIVPTHREPCTRCESKKQYEALSIDVFEDWLPLGENEAKCVVVELEAPVFFSTWRTALFIMLGDVFKGRRFKPRSLENKVKLSSNDPFLSDRFVEHPGERIGLVSESKAVTRTHYAKKPRVIDLSLDQICASNNLQYRYYDLTSETDASRDSEFQKEQLSSCTYTVAAKTLQLFLSRSSERPEGQDPNYAVARQHSHSETMSSPELHDLATLPLGTRLVWPNLLLQLAMPGVDLSKPDTTSFILQCIYQAGPPAATHSHRQSHGALLDKALVLQILKHTESCLERIRGNWEQSQALFSCVAIVARVLNLCRTAKDVCFGSLKTARDIACAWTKKLEERAHDTTSASQRDNYRAKAFEVALTVSSTFDVEDALLDEVLSRTEDAAQFIQASITIHKLSQDLEVHKGHISLMMLRHKRLLYRSLHYVAQNSDALDAAVEQQWPAYRPAQGGEGWHIPSPAQKHLLITQTAPGAGAKVLKLSYDAFSGELLVGSPDTNHPPLEYRQDPLYKALFSDAILEVMPASLSGFSFSAKRLHRAFTVHLGMLNSRLAVRATGSKGSFEAVPTDVLPKTLPSHFKAYVLWYNLSEERVDFHPPEDPWCATPVWSLIKSGMFWTLTKGNASVVEPESTTAKALTTLLEPLADATDIYCLYRRKDSFLEVKIPSLRLSFVLAQGTSHLTSREYRDMAVDQDQSVGSLIGFSNKLVLSSPVGKRIALILEGHTEYTQKGRHVAVNIALDARTHVYALEIDKTLCRLKDNGDLSCRLYLAHLHALTSFCLPDPLLQQTGTARALQILRSRAVRSFAQLPQADVDRLVSIADISPTRSFYPPGLAQIQQVAWDEDLPSPSQVDDFSLAVADILNEQLLMLRDFFPGSEIDIPDMEAELAPETLLRRNSDIRDVAHDVVYKSRDVASHQSTRTQNIAIVAGLVCRRTASKHWKKSFVEPLRSLLAKSGDIPGPGTSPKRLLDISQMRFNPSLLTSFEPNITKLFALLESLREPSAVEHQFTVLIWLCALMFDPASDVSIIQCLAMTFAGFHVDLETPAHQLKTADRSFQTSHGQDFERRKIEQIVEAGKLSYGLSRESRLPQKSKQEDTALLELRREKTWAENSKAVISQVVESFQKQWPIELPSEPDVPMASSYLLLGRVTTNVKSQFQIWHDNGALYTYLEAMQQALDKLPTAKIDLPPCTLRLEAPGPSLPGFVSEADLFAVPAPALPTFDDDVLMSPATSEVLMQSSDSRLRSLISRLRSPVEGSVERSAFESEYAKDLEHSLEALLARFERPWTTNIPSRKTFEDHRRSCQLYADRLYGILASEIMSNPRVARSIQAQSFPPICSSLLIAQLAHGRWHSLSAAWQHRLVQYAIALTMVQRATRLLGLGGEDLLNELAEQGHANWDPQQSPETLLIEVESGILIREKQARIAAEMRQPSGGGNAICQLNMGEGKSSVIIPIVAAALADGSSLVCVVVGKPQSKQAEQMMVSKLGGLCDRRVFFFPFSRDVKLSADAASRIHGMLLKCMRERGILLVQPAHLLSFRLIGIELLLRGKTKIAALVNSTCDFIDKRARILVDESDENFSTRFELIYTIGGAQNIVEMGHARWSLIHEVLDLVRRLAPKIANKFPSAVEIRQVSEGGFPSIRILHHDASECLLELLANEICDFGLKNFRLHRQPQHIRQAVRAYITKHELSPREVYAVEESSLWEDGDSRRHLLLLRGLLACGLLAFVFGQKRWRVSYGLTTRSPTTRLAVPYLAKDSPTARSEFSHPDIVILLTTLAHYYGGLNDNDLTAAYRHLVESKEADVEYAFWVADSPNLPRAYKDLSGVNLTELQPVFPSLRRSKRVVDYFLTHLVFPQFMKQFPGKLCASGWDIGKTRPNITTGFSGTIDSRCLLPLDMNFLDLEDQRHTNALVLDNLLRSDHGLQCMSYASARELLSLVLELDPPVQVILDVGAQIIELDNLAMAKAWLKAAPASKEAVIFVDDNDELRVLDRTGGCEWFLSSSFQGRLDSCLIYLDQGHTRGIDIKMPVHFRAAVTLGAHLTKDALVQACMRLRKLGKGQTVVFCVPDEVQTKIRDSLAIPAADALVPEDVLLWAMGESLAQLRRQTPLWAAQGERFVSHNKVWESARDDSGNVALVKQDAEQYREKEARTLEEQYHPRTGRNDHAHDVDPVDPSLIRIVQRCQMVGREDVSSNSFSEEQEQEQERELAPEIEREKVIQPKLSVKSARHSLHDDVVRFALEGQLEDVHASKAYDFAFSIASGKTKQPLPGVLNDESLLATYDFIETVEGIKGSAASFKDFQRPVRWLLLGYSTGAKKLGMANRAMFVSPYEADKLHAIMGPDSVTSLHLYKARVKPGVAPLDDLRLYSWPRMGTKPSMRPALLAQLNLFAGQLYFSAYGDYLEMCKFLGMSTVPPDASHEERGIKHDPTGFIIHERNLNLQISQELKGQPKKRGGRKHKKKNTKENGQHQSAPQNSTSQNSAPQNSAPHNNAPQNSAPQHSGGGQPSDSKQVFSDRSRFQQSALPFLKEWLALRNQGLSLEKTHMDDLLNGNVLRETDFDR